MEYGIKDFFKSFDGQMVGAWWVISSVISKAAPEVLTQQKLVGLSYSNCQGTLSVLSADDGADTLWGMHCGIEGPE